MNNDKTKDFSLASVTAKDDDMEASMNVPFETPPLNNQNYLRSEKNGNKKKDDDDDNWQGPVELHHACNSN